MISQPADLLCQREVQRFDHPVGLQIGLRPGGRSQIVFPLQILVAVGLGKQHKIADHHRRLLQIILREPVPRHHQLRKPLQIGRICIGKAHQRRPPDALRVLRILADEPLDPSPDLFFQLLRAPAGSCSHPPIHIFRSAAAVLRPFDASGDAVYSAVPFFGTKRPRISARSSSSSFTFLSMPPA